MAMDSTRRWLVAASSGWIMLFNFAVIRSAAVFYVVILQSFEVTREEASWPLNLAVVLTNCAGPLAGILSRYIAIWKLLLVASATNSLAVSACCLARNVGHLTIMLGVVHGSSNAFTGLCYTVINQHFCRYRAVASGFCNAGVALGGLIFAPLAQFFFQEFGGRGAFFLCGAVTLHATVGALFLRLLPKAASGTPPCTSTNITRLRVSVGRMREPPQNDVCSNVYSAFVTQLGLLKLRDPKTRNTMKMTPSDHCSDVIIHPRRVTSSLSASVEIPNASWELRNFQSYPGYPLAESSCSPETTSNVFGCTQTSGDLNSPLTSENRGGNFLSVLKTPKFYLVCFSFSIVHMNMTTYLSNITDLAKDRNVSDWNALFLVTIYACADLTARLVSGVLTDKEVLQRSSMMAASFVLWTVSMCLAPFCSSYYLHVLVSVAAGWCTGAAVILIPVIFMDIVHPDKFSPSYGLMCLTAGLVLLARPALIGYFRDKAGDYRGMFLVHGLLTATGASLWLSISFAEKWRKQEAVGLPKASIGIETVSREHFRKANEHV